VYVLHYILNTKKLKVEKLKKITLRKNFLIIGLSGRSFALSNKIANEEYARGLSTLKMETIRSSEMSVHTRSTRCHIPEDGILHSHLCENLRFYKIANDVNRVI
jgi:hypothetical protein